MLLPSIREVVELNEVLGDIKYNVRKWLIVMNSSLDNLIIKPVLGGFDETPQIVIDGNLNIRCSGYWLLVDEGSTLIKFCGDGSEVRVSGKAIPIDGNTILRVYGNTLSLISLGDGVEREVVKDFQELDVRRLYGSNIAVVGGKGRKYLILPNSRQNLLELHELHYADSLTTALLVVRMWRKRVAVIMYHKYLGVSKLYELSGCSKVKEVSVGDGLGLVRCDDENYLISPSDVRKIPIALEPLAHCNNLDILYDPLHNILIEFNGYELRPLLHVPKPRILGSLSNNSLVMLSNNIPYILNSNVWKPITSQRVLNGFTGREYILLKTLGGLDIYRYESYLVTYKPLDCGVIGNNLVCVLDKNLYIFDLDHMQNAEVRLTKESIDISSYPKLIISPWYEFSQLRVGGPVTLVNADPPSPLSKAFNIKPLKLSREISIKVYYDALLINLEKELRIQCPKPEVGKVTLNKVKYSPSGFLEGSDKNAVINLRAGIINPLPEDLPLIVRFSTNDNYDCSEFTHDAKPGANELDLLTYLRVKHPVVTISLEYRWFNFKELLAALTLDLGKYRVDDPLDGISYDVDFIDYCKSRVKARRGNAGIPVDIEVMCSNNVKYVGTNEVVVSDCLLPAVLTMKYRYDEFQWSKYFLINGGSVINVKAALSPTTSVTAVVGSKCVNGFMSEVVNLNVRLPNPVKELYLVPRVCGGKLALDINYKLLNEGIIAVLSEGKLTSSTGREGTLVISFDDIPKNVAVVTLSNSIRKVFVVEYVDLMRGYLELCSRIATLLKPKVLGEGVGVN